jgi:TPR repeat protein
MDAGKIFVVEPKPKVRRRHAGAGVLAAGALIVAAVMSREDPCARAGVPDAPVPPSMAGLFDARSDLDRAKVDYEAGRFAAAFPRFRQLAESNNPEAMGFVGVMLLRGQGTAARPDSGIHWLREAAYDRDPKAMTALGHAYQNGEGVNHSLVRAREWYHKAVDEKQWPEAMRRLGALDLREQKHDAALTWFQKAARAGSVDARVDIAQLYEHGQGRPRDPEVAYCLYRTAAKAGSPRGVQALRELKAK